MSEADEKRMQDLSKEGDWLLRLLVDIATTSGGLGITLHASGFLVSGVLCSEREYLERFGDLYGTALAQLPSGLDAGASVRESFRITAETLDASPNAPVYIHLRDARYFHPGGAAIPGNDSILWRGRIVDVAGFTLGSLSSS